MARYGLSTPAVAAEYHRKEVPVVISEDEAHFIVENGGVLLHIQRS